MRLGEEEGKVVLETAKLCKVPSEKLRRWVVKPPKPIGSGFVFRALSPLEEVLIVVGLQTSGRFGCACETIEVKHVVTAYLDNAQRKQDLLITYLEKIGRLYSRNGIA